MLFTINHLPLVLNFSSRHSLESYLPSSVFGVHESESYFAKFAFPHKSSRRRPCDFGWPLQLQRGVIIFLESEGCKKAKRLCFDYCSIANASEHFVMSCPDPADLIPLTSTAIGLTMNHSNEASP